MIEIKKKYELRGLNTLKIRCKADYFCEAFSTEDCIEALSFASDNKIPFLVIGGGTNIVFSQNFEGLVVKNSIMHRSIIENNVVLGSGESWHNSVLWTIKNNLYGLENLSLIPGSVGAAPVQNIGAYGEEISSYIESIKAIKLSNLSLISLNNRDCNFSYRSSLFKESAEYIITEITLRLRPEYKTNITYKSLGNYIKEEGIDHTSLTARQVSNCVCNLRNNILPDPKESPNVGSFFKNLTLNQKSFDDLQSIIKTPFHITQQGDYKISTAFLIENAGWKGKKIGEMSVSNKHALVLVSSGKADGSEVIGFADQIIEDIKKKYHVSIEVEPSVI
jgi:UDP-N-acetylmuramate dehydrogenase